MFKDILLSEILPRDISSFSSSFIEGLQMVRFFGYFFLFGALLLFSISAFKFKMIVPSVIFILLATMSVFMIRHVNHTTEMRKQAFLKGDIIIGTVKEHGRKFNPFKSTRDYTILVSLKNNSSQELLKIVHKDKRLWSSSPVGSEVVGLKYDDFYFWGEEVGCRFNVERN